MRHAIGHDDGNMDMERFYYHGTSPDRARLIRREGFKLGPLMLPGWDEPYYAGGGNIGTGTYISADWRVALWYGRILIRIRLEPGTRLLEMPPEPDAKVLAYLKREFGSEILRCRRPDKVLPRNKRLTLDEHIAILGYHYREVGRYFWCDRHSLNTKRHKAKREHVLAMHALGADLRRFGIHGYGEPRDFNGIVVFEPSRLRVDRRIAIPVDTWKVVRDRVMDDLDAIRSWSDVGLSEDTLCAPSKGR